MSDKSFEWSAGNGQCPCCLGNQPNRGWWTDTVGHKIYCELAQLMKDAGKAPKYEHENPERMVGMYDSQKGKPGNHFLSMIRFNDPEKEKKLASR